jgi:antitoxin (DNA-binding transcriptional repressor) of toxin-antitoxin stability system
MNSPLSSRQGAERAKALPFRSKGVFGAFEKQASLPVTLDLRASAAICFKRKIALTVNHDMIHILMKTATVRDLRTRFPVVEGWLAEGESVAITKSGKRIAMLTKADPVPEVSPRSAFAKRFGTPLPRPRKPTKIAQTLIEDRGE